MTLDSKLYDRLKPVVLIYLPALAAAYFAIASIWGIPDTQNVIGTISIVTTFLGSVLGLSSKNYAGDGHIVMDEAGLKTIKMPDLTAEDIAAKGKITLKVTTDSGKIEA
jgi:hypothetical protein